MDQSQPLEPLAYTINESCKISKVGRNAVYEAIATGALRARKLGTRTLILRDDLRAWLENLPDLAPRSGGASESEKLPGKTRAPAETATAPSLKRRLVAAE